MILFLLALIGFGAAVGAVIGTFTFLDANIGGGPIARGIRRENKAAQQAYLVSLSAEDRKAYEHHEVRKRAYEAFGRYQRDAVSDWDDVTKAPDFPDPRLLPEDPWGLPRKWSPPRWRVGDNAKFGAFPPWRTGGRRRGNDK